MKKIVISLLLSVIFTFGAIQGAISAVAEAKRNEDTPVAQIANDDYVPYNYKNKTVDALNGSTSQESAVDEVTQLVKSAGGYVETSASESEYISAQNKNTDAVAAYAEGYGEEVKQIITVMTTATGSKEHGNYVESKSVANAIVRINGVPRYTDRNGQIKVTFTKDDYVELYVEKDGYNPYIEIMEVTGEEKVVHLKQPSDDIDVFGAVVNYLGQDFDVFKNKCFLNTSLMQNYFYLTVYSNIQADAYYLLINGKKVCYSSTGKFQRIAFFNNDYAIKENDVFQLQVYYEGIESKIYDLNIKVVKTFINLNKILQNLSFNKVDAGKMEFGDDNFTDLGSLDTSFNKSIINKIVESINKTGASFSFGKASIELEYLYFPETAEIQFSVGFSYEFEDDSLTKLEDKLNSKFIKNEDREKKINEIQSDISKAQDEIDKINKKINQSNTNQDNYEKRKKEAIANLEKKRKEFEENTNDPKYIENEAQIKNLQRQYNANIRRYEKQAEERNKQIDQLNTKIENGQAGIEKLKSMFTNLPEIKQKVKDLIGIIQNGPSTGVGFNVKSAIELMGVVTFNLYTESFEKAKVTVGIKVDLSFTWQGVIVIPVFFKITVSGEVRTEIKLNGLKSFSFADFISSLYTILELSLRLDAGVGISGLASASVFGTIGIEFDFSWGSAFIDGEQPFKITFKYGYGIKLEFLWFEHEISNYNEIVLLQRKEFLDEATTSAHLMTRSFSSKEESINQKFTNLFQNSESKILELNGKKYIFWLEDCLTRDDYNRTVLKYSVCENGEWTEPSAVNDDGRGDLNFDIAIHNGEIYVAYQKSNKLFDSSDGVKEVLSAQEIYVAKYNLQSNSFISCAVTGNTVMDVLPQFAVHNNGKLYLSWLSNSENDALGFSGTNTLYYSSLDNNVWTRPVKYYETEQIIKSWTSAVSDGNLSIAVSLDADNDLSTMDSNIQKIGRNKILLIEDAFNPEFMEIDGTINLYYSKDDNLCVIDGNNKEVVLGEAQLFGNNYRLFYSDGELYVVYEKVSGEYKQAFYSIFDIETNDWTYNIPVASEKGNMYGTNLLLSGGEKRFVYNLQDESYNTVLCELKKTAVCEIEIKAVNYFGKIENNKEIELCIEVFNGGDIDVRNLKFELFNKIFEIALPSKLRIGESRNLFLTVVPELIYNKDDIIKVYALSDGGAELASYEYIVNTASTDIELAVKNSIKNGIQMFEVNISNLSVYDTDAVLYVYNNGEEIKQISIKIKGEQIISEEYSFDNLKEDDYLYFKVETAMDDCYAVNNGCGLYSMANSKNKEVHQNIYREVLEFAKVLV